MWSFAGGQRVKGETDNVIPRILLISSHKIGKHSLLQSVVN
jgi:hypothetical protein